MGKEKLRKIAEHIRNYGSIHGSLCQLMLFTPIAWEDKLIVAVSVPSRKSDSEDSLALADNEFDVHYFNGMDKDRALLMSHETSLPPTIHEHVATIVMNQDTHRTLKSSAQQKLDKLLKENGVEDLHCALGADGLYEGVTSDNCGIIIRYSDETSEDCIYVEIYKPYDSLRKDSLFLQKFKNDCCVNGDYFLLGHCQDWIENGTEANRPTPSDIYFADIPDDVKGAKKYCLQNEFYGETKAESVFAVPVSQRMFISNCALFIAHTKDFLVNLIKNDYAIGKQVKSDTPIRYADEDGDAEVVGANFCVGVCLQMSQNEKTTLQLCFIYGDRFENPSSSIGVSLEKLPIETLIQIYENLM